MATLQLVAADRQNKTFLLRVLRFTPEQESELTEELSKGDSTIMSCGAFWLVDIGDFNNYLSFYDHIKKLMQYFNPVYVTPSDKAHAVFDALLDRLHLTSETRPRGTFIESFGSISYIRYSGQIVAAFDDKADMSVDIANAKAQLIIDKYGPPVADNSEDLFDPHEIPPCFQIP